jgi:TrkA domain protein
MTVYESDLPGVGKKFEVEIDEGTRLVIVIHNTGKREVYRREGEADSERLFELSDRLARQIGTILEGAYFQPIRAGTIDTMLSDDTLIEWAGVPDGSPLAGKTLAESDLRRRAGISVIAIQRGDETITNPDAETDLQAGDTLVVIGSREACRALDGLVAADE